MKKKLLSLGIIIFLCSLYLFACFGHYEILKTMLFGVCFGWTIEDILRKIKNW